MAIGRTSGALRAVLAGRLSTIGIVAAALAGVVLCSVMVLRTSAAMFSGSTGNPSDSWATGTVALSDDDAGTALFSSAADGLLTGGQVLTRCIVVRYDGSLTSGTSVKLYGTATGTLAPYLDLTVDQGSGGGGAGSCSGFGLTSAGIFTGTLADFGTNASSFGTGVGTWTPASAAATMTYRFTITVQTVTGAQGKSAAGTFTWEAQG